MSLPKVVSRRNLPARVPVQFGITLWLLFDRVSMPHLEPVVWTLYGVICLLCFIISCMEEKVEIL